VKPAALMLCICLAATARAAPATPASKQQAKLHFERGNQLYSDGQYDQAIDELEAGYALDPRPDFLYALGQAERKRGRCAAAVRWYDAYLDTGPTPQRREAAQLQIDRCKEEQAATPPAATAPAPAPAPIAAPPVAAAPAATTTAPPAVAAPHRTPIYERWWLWTTVVGVVAVGVGVGVGVALALEKPSFDPTLPDLNIGRAALGVRF